MQPEPIPDGEVRQAFHAARDAADRAWADDAALTREVQVPWGRMPGAVVIGAYLTETVTHTWDLWMATGASTPLDPELGAVAAAAAHRAVPAGRDQFRSRRSSTFRRAQTAIPGWRGGWDDRPIGAPPPAASSVDE